MSETDPNDPLCHDDRLGQAVLRGSIAATLTAAIWAALAIFTKTEMPIAAWAVGVAVGTTMLLTTKQGSLRLGLVSLGLTLFGLVLAKGLIDHFGTLPRYLAEFHDPADARDALRALDWRQRFGLDDLGFFWTVLALFSAWRFGRGKGGG